VAGGAASTAGNWNPVQAPTAADDLTFNLNNVYTVTWSAAANASRTQTFRRGTVTMSLTAPHTTSNGLTVGDLNADNATMTLTTGTMNSSAAAVIGNAAGSTGVVNVNDDDADLITGGTADLTVGNGGNGTLNITGTGHVQVADQFLAGSNATSVASVDISGFSIAPFGNSKLEVLGASDSRIGSGGDVTMSITNGGIADFAARLIIANGSASSSSITVEDVGLLPSALVVDGELFVGRNVSAGTAAGVGTLFLNTGGQATVQGNTRLGDPDGGTGTISLGGGTFNGSQPISMELGSSIVGTGTVNADVNVVPGSIVATTATGITMNGIINNTGAGVFGTKIHFGATGGYTGSGSCNVDITGDTTAMITATGALNLGKNTTSGVSYNGMITVGNNSVTLVDTNGAVLGGVTTIGSGGNVSCSNGIGLANAGRIRGEGTLTGDVICSGVLDPQRSPTPGGIMQINGNLHMNPTGIFDMDIGGAPTSSQYDRCNVSNTATFGGALRVALPTGYTPKVGEQFIAINATAGRIGELDSIIPPSPGPCNNVTFVLVYSSTAAIVLIRPPLGCTALGDLNSDGGCTGADIQEFVNSIMFGPYNNCSDMNADCANTADDIPIFVNCLL
jgi:T5SS/PEP-CTERM-associated repeat protein